MLWDAHDKSAKPSILHTEFTFRGSLGQQKFGHAGFAEYLDSVHQALGDYRCHIEALVEEGDQVFANMRCRGVTS
ncbi:nuclear transport factor 2 family protein [Sedimenticola sp.]|uniref:nuclear transport factor 2 family protein n=1 Tax=Sedimenticola sp. TaxID=1940285 RepID=UPI003D0A24C5